MKRNKLTAEQIEKISAVQEKSNLTRATATKRVLAGEKKSRSRKVEPVADAKQLAANDKPEVVSGPTPQPKAETAAVPTTTKLTPEQAGAARAEGARLYKIAGRPSKADFQLVYGDKGHALTWVARAKVAGLASADEAAAKFQEMLAAKRAPAPAPAPVADNAEVVATVTEEVVVKKGRKGGRKVTA